MDPVEKKKEEENTLSASRELDTMESEMPEPEPMIEQTFESEPTAPLSEPEPVPGTVSEPVPETVPVPVPVPVPTTELSFPEPAKKTKKRCPKGCVKKTRCRMKKRRSKKAKTPTTPPASTGFFSGGRRKRKNKTRKSRKSKK